MLILLRNLPVSSGKYAVFSSNESYRGEILAKAFEQILQYTPHLSEVLFLNSAGGLGLNPMSDIIYPSHILTSEDQLVPNFQVATSEKNRLIHISVQSVLQETRDCISDRKGSGAGIINKTVYNRSWKETLELLSDFPKKIENIRPIIKCVSLF